MMLDTRTELTSDSTELYDAVSKNGEPQIADFDLRSHLERTPRSQAALRHVRVGLENWITTKMMQQAVRTAPEVPQAYKPRWGQYKQIEKECHSLVTKKRQLVVFAKMPFMGGFGERSTPDFDREIRNYEVLDYPKHYLQPFHSLPGGWLSPRAAAANESAMRALFAPATKRGAEGLREAVAEQVPKGAKLVYDFGCCCGVQGQYFAQRLGPDARIVCIDPSPFGLIQGRHDITDPRIEFMHDFAERAPLPESSGDIVNMFFLLHETPDFIKRELIAKAFKVLKPGGRVLIHEPPLWDLEYRSRGFFEPFRIQWPHFDGRKLLSEAGFTQIRQEDVADPDYVHSWHAEKPR